MCFYVCVCVYTYVMIYWLSRALPIKRDHICTWICIVVKIELNMTCSTTKINKDLTNSSPKLLWGVGTFFSLQTLLETLKLIVCHHEKSSSVSHNAKSEAIFYTFRSYSPMCQILKSIHLFCRKLFFTFFPLYRVIKKVKARCIKQKSKRLCTGLCWGNQCGNLVSADCGSEESWHLLLALCLSVSGILLEIGGCGGGGGGVWSRVGEGGLSEVAHTPSDTPAPLDLRVCQNNPSLALTLADSASFLSVLKRERERERGRTCQHQQCAWPHEKQPQWSSHWESVAA